MKIVIFSYAASQRHNNKDAMRLLYNNILPLTFICKFRKDCSKFACEREPETEHNWYILTPKLLPSALCLSRSPWLLNRALAFLTTTRLTPPPTILLVLNSTRLCPARRTQLTGTQLSSVQFVGLILPSNSHASIWTRLRNSFRYLATGMCHFRFLWNGLCDRHRAEITVIQFRGHSLPVRQSMRV